MQCLLSLITLESSGVRCTNAHFTVSLATTCWTIHPTWGPVYAGTVAVTNTGKECRAWDAPQEIYPTYGLDSMYPSDKNSRTAASNYCRIFSDGYLTPWCFVTFGSDGNWPTVTCHRARWCHVSACLETNTV